MQHIVLLIWFFMLTDNCKNLNKLRIVSYFGTDDESSCEKWKRLVHYWNGFYVLLVGVHSYLCYDVILMCYGNSL